MKPLTGSCCRVLSLLLGLPAVGCASAAPPPAVVDAQAALDHTTPGAVLARSSLIAEGKELLEKARKLAETGESERASLYARQATQKFQMANAFAEREQVETFLAALEKSRKEPAEGETAKPAPERERSEPTIVVVPSSRETIRETTRVENAPPPPPPPPPAPARDTRREGSLRALAERKLVELQFKRSEALGDMKDRTCAPTFREYDSILQLAQVRFDVGDYERAYEFALRAEERFRACDTGGHGVTPAAKPPAAEDAAASAATASIQKAQIELARAQAVAFENPDTKQGQALLTSAVGWFEKRSFKEATDLSGRAYALLVRVKAAAPTAAQAAKPVDAKPADAKPADACQEAKSLVDESKEADKALGTAPLAEPAAKARREGQAAVLVAEKKLTEKACPAALTSARTATAAFARAGADKSVAASTTKPALGGVRPWEAAVGAIREAEKARGLASTRVANDADRTTFGKGEEALRNATRAYEKDDLTTAERQASDARNFFDGIRAKPAELKTAEPGKPQEAKPAQAPPADPVAVAEKRVASYQGADLPADPAWKNAYTRVYRALALRDAAAANAAPQNKLAEADKRLAESRAAWTAKKYVQAQAAADAAIVILEPLASAPADSGSAEELEAARRSADDALREAGQFETVCEKEACGDRDVKKLAAAKGLLDSAKRAYEAKRFKATVDLAKQARDQFDAVLHIALPAATPTDAEKEKAFLKDAEDATRDATIAKKLCEEKGCRERDAEAIVRANETLLSSQVACSDHRYSICRDRAREAEKAYKGVLASAPTFEVPSDVQGVTRSGNVLIVAPPVVFLNGTSTLDSKSASSVAAVAKTLIANKKALQKVSLVGYSDNRGPAAQNQKLSTDRAAQFKAALVSKGVPADLVTSEGRGPANPIDDNNTAAGRERNRRVEIHIELAAGAK